MNSRTIYYIDTCILLNLFKKEEPFWKPAKEFFEKVMFSEENKLAYSGLVLKELKYKLIDEKYAQKLNFLKKEFKFIKVKEEDYELARKYERKYEFRLSFFDFLHISLCKRLDMVLVTRDKEMITIGKEHIKIEKPEDLIHLV